MASGDAQRIWFPEMIEKIKTRWTSSMTWEELTEFCRMITEERKQIRESRGIQPPRSKCTHCGTVSRTDIHAVSIRSALFVLKNNGVLSEDEFKELDKQWKKYRKEKDLDPNGNKKSQNSDVKSNRTYLFRA